jgi:transcriptional regulator with XRE-family HTH domain
LPVISGEQLRAARALLRWDQRRLAASSGVSPETVKRLELTEGPVSAYTGTVEALRRALEEAGVMFVEADAHGGAGVRFRTVSANAGHDDVNARPANTRSRARPARR